MEALLQETARYLSLAIQAIAILVVAIGVVKAFVGTLPLVLGGRASDAEMRAVWLGFAHWLVAGLTFQLAADIVQTTVAPSWGEIGRVAAIAAIRTFLTYFLDRDIDAMRGREAAPSDRGDSARRT
ncbi:MAG TPA: DUF1622 domain-containing protein [Burkholderiales bacterium]|nr:DUF1622 domain-containing protein [Burkholderiales bacterium]